MGALVAACFAALVKAAQFAVQAVAASVMAAIALCLAMAGALLAVLAIAFRGLAEYATVIVKAACVAVAVFGVALAFGPAWSSFGGDLPALLPAACVLLSPAAFALLAGLGFGGLLLAGVVTIVLGALLPALHPAARILALMAVIGATFANSLITNGAREDEQVQA
jgi:hypothetical protein